MTTIAGPTTTIGDQTTMMTTMSSGSTEASSSTIASSSSIATTSNSSAAAANSTKAPIAVAAVWGSIVCWPPILIVLGVVCIALLLQVFRFIFCHLRALDNANRCFFRFNILLASCCWSQRRNYERRIEEMREKPKESVVAPMTIPLRRIEWEQKQEVETLQKQNETLNAQLAGLKSSKENLKKSTEGQKALDSAAAAAESGSREKLASAANANATLEEQIEARDKKIKNLKEQVKEQKRDVKAAIYAHKQTLENPICTNKWCHDCIWRRSCEKTAEKSNKKLDAKMPTAAVAAPASSGEPIGSAETQKSTSQQYVAPTENAPRKRRSK